MRAVNVECVYPPVPYRDMDYRATFEGYEPGDAMGWGRTAAEAEADLLDNDDAYCSRCNVSGMAQFGDGSCGLCNGRGA